MIRKILSRKALFMVAAAILMAAVPATTLHAQEKSEQQQIAESTLVKVGDKAPDFKVTMVDGSSIRPLCGRGVRFPAHIARRGRQDRQGLPPKERIQVPCGTRPRAGDIQTLRLELHPPQLRHRQAGQNRISVGRIRREGVRGAYRHRGRTTQEVTTNT